MYVSHMAMLAAADFIRCFRTSMSGPEWIKDLFWRSESGQDARTRKRYGEYFCEAKYSMLKNVHGRTFFSGILKELQARRSNSEPLSVIWKMVCELHIRVQFTTRVCSANSGTYSVPDLVSEREKGLFWGESTGRTPVWRKVRRVFCASKNTRCSRMYRDVHS